MTKTLTTMLVGAHFRPPAKFLLAALPAGTMLELVPEPDNPYDAAAIRVMLPHSSMLDELAEQIEVGLQGTGFAYLDLDWPVHLGYCAASGNKQLAKAREVQPELVSNQDILDYFEGSAEAVGDATASLAFGPDGAPQVRIEREED